MAKYIYSPKIDTHPPFENNFDELIYINVEFDHNFTITISRKSDNKKLDGGNWAASKARAINRSWQTRLNKYCEHFKLIKR